MHWLVVLLPDTNSTVAQFSKWYSAVMSVFSGSLPDQLLVCACLGALETEAQACKGPDRAANRIMAGFKQDSMNMTIYDMLSDIYRVWPSL